jgi:wyosine [tRNA(Phe)-imidazoG37] synthetase (radical SAM superfamily)
MQSDRNSSDLIPLKTGLLYGPVNSRRYGRSLGINLYPGDRKVCSFNCVYCHFGWTKRTVGNAGESEPGLATVSAVADAVEEALQSEIPLDLITFSGNGEPTLHPQFPEIVDEVVRIRNRHRPNVRVALLSNSTGLLREEVRRSVPKINLPVFKLDAGTESGFKAMNRPHGTISYDDILAQLTAAQSIYLQSVLVDGIPSNSSAADLEAYCERVKAIAPRQVHLYSIDRPVPNTQLRLIPPERLREIAAMVTERTGITATAFHK